MLFTTWCCSGMLGEMEASLNRGGCVEIDYVCVARKIRWPDRLFFVASEKETNRSS